MKIQADAYRDVWGKRYGVVYAVFYGGRAVFVRWVREGSKHARHGFWLVCGWGVPGTLPERRGSVEIEPIIDTEDRNRIRTHFSFLQGVITFLPPEPVH